jgi:hypothetical protein
MIDCEFRASLVRIEMSLFVAAGGLAWSMCIGICNGYVVEEEVVYHGLLKACKTVTINGTFIDDIYNFTSCDLYKASLTTSDSTGASPFTTPAFWRILTVFSIMERSTLDASLTCSTVFNQSRASCAVYPRFAAIYSIPSSICA